MAQEGQDCLNRPDPGQPWLVLEDIFGVAGLALTTLDELPTTAIE